MPTSSYPPSGPISQPDSASPTNDPVSSQKTATHRRGRKLLNDEQALYEYAVGVLGRGMRTVAELKRLLRQRVASPEVGETMIEAVLARLHSHQYLSDTRYAATYASLRREGRRLGPRRVAQDLRNKGVAAEVVAREVAAAYEDTDEETQARAFLARKRVAAPTAGDERAKARILRMLVRAGFSPTIGWKILRAWNVAPDEYPDIE